MLRREFFRTATNRGKPFTLFPSLVEVLQSPHIHKVGSATAIDAKRLQDEFPGLTVKGVVDVQHLPIYRRCRPKKLAALVSLFFNVRINKDEQVTDWEQSNLTVEQIAYAATDAWASLVVYWRLMSIPYVVPS